jgi:hypothetical protein
MALKCPATFRIEPSESYVRITGSKYKFKCYFSCQELLINGREPLGEEERKFFPHIKSLPEKDGWKSRECSLKCPGIGVWRVMFWINDIQICTQTIIAGLDGNLSLTAMEKAALIAHPR